MLLYRALQILSAAARADTSSFTGAGGMPLLTTLLTPLALGPNDAPPPHAHIVLPAAAHLLDRSTRVAVGVAAALGCPGLTAVLLRASVTDTRSGGLAAFLGGSSQLLGASGGGGGGLGVSARRGGGGDGMGSAALSPRMRRLGSLRSLPGVPTSPDSSSGVVSGGGGGGGGFTSRTQPGGEAVAQQLTGASSANGGGGVFFTNAHLDPTLRVLERLAAFRGGEGVEALKSAGANGMLGALWELAVSCGRRTEALALRVMGRLLGTFVLTSMAQRQQYSRNLALFLAT